MINIVERNIFKDIFLNFLFILLLMYLFEVKYLFILDNIDFVIMVLVFIVMIIFLLVILVFVF